MKSWKKILKWVISPFTLGLVVTALIVYASIDYYASRNSITKNDHSLASLIQQFHEKTLDWRLVDRAPQKGSDRVAILAIDERAIEQEGRFPWPRDKVALLVDKALELGAKSVSFDIIFSESDQNSSIPTLQKLRRGMASKQQLSTDLNAMIETEISATDGDRIFADTIKKHADRLILGSYFDATESATPYKDFCNDAAFERTYESRYWKKEAAPLTVIDSPLNKIGFPSPLKAQLGDYFVRLEVQKAVGWFEAHPEINARITENLESWSSIFSPETYPGLATLWLNNDVESAKAFLGQLKPEAANEAGVSSLFTHYAAAFTKQESAMLVQSIRESTKTYCKNFLGPEDDLLDYGRYEFFWGKEQAKETFKDSSLADAWNRVQSSRAPSNTPGLQPESFEDAIARFKRDSLPNQVQAIDRWWVNIPLLGDVTKHTGFFNARQDTDGSIRRTMVLARQGNAYMPSLSLKTFLIDKNYTAIAKVDVEDVGAKEVSTKVAKSLEIYDAEGNSVMQVPIDTHGQMMINYSGGRNMFPYVSAADLLTPGDEMEIEVQTPNEKTGRWQLSHQRVNKKLFLKDKLLIVGATAIGLYDLRVTPFEENFPGIETHANVLSNLLVEQDRAKGLRTPASAPGFLRVHPQEERLMWIALLGIGLTISALLAYFGSLAGLGITASAMSGIYAVDRYFLFGQGVVTTILFPQFEIFGTFVTLTFYKYFTEERKKRELKGTFEKYVSPSIVAEIMSDPENIELGGKKMELTVMFSDIRGFTKFSEKLDPRELSNFLNSYLTPMTNLVFKNKGTLDKYMGDAIMAFWGAPIHFPDHAKHAARCALQMLEKLRELQVQYRAKGLPDVDIGIGLNSGEMSVGNMGSDTVRSYTVMGDAVNLGSRLEGINKEYGTRIIVSEFTQKALGPGFTTREVDWVRVKGKEQPVRIFELVCEGPARAEVQTLLAAFARGFGLYHEAKFAEALSAFKDALVAEPDDAVSQLYVQRCEDYLHLAPPEDWDGVFQMLSK